MEGNENHKEVCTRGTRVLWIYLYHPCCHSVIHLAQEICMFLSIIIDRTTDCHMAYVQLCIKVLQIRFKWNLNVLLKWTNYQYPHTNVSWLNMIKLYCVILQSHYWSRYFCIWKSLVCRTAVSPKTILILLFLSKISLMGCATCIYL